MRYHASYTLVCLGALLLLLVACAPHELCEEHPHGSTLRVRFDWRLAPDADPMMMSVWLYPEEGGGSPIRFTFPGRSGGDCSVVPGRYRAVTYNAGLDHVYAVKADAGADSLFLSTSTTDLLAGLPSASLRGGEPPRSPDTRDESVLFSPDRVWTAQAEGIVVVAETGGEVTFLPSEATCRYTVTVTGVENLQTADGAWGTISGMAEGVWPWGQRAGGGPVTLPFEVRRDVTDGSLQAVFYTFGCADASVPHHLLLYLTQTDGGQYYYDYDVTDQVHAAPNPHRINILIDGLSLPLPSSGLSLSLADWEEVVQEMRM